MTVDRFGNILAIESHGTASDQGTLHLSLASARDNLDAAGIGERVRASLADNGYLSRSAMNAPSEGVLLIAVSRTGRRWTPRSTYAWRPV